MVGALTLARSSRLGTSVTTDQPRVPVEVLEEATLEAARAWCRTRFDYAGPYLAEDGAERHQERDARRAAEDPAFRSAIAFAAPILYAAGRDRLVEAGSAPPPDLGPEEKRLLLRLALGTFDSRTECRFRHRRTRETLSCLDLRVHDLDDWETEDRLVVEADWRPRHA